MSLIISSHHTRPQWKQVHRTFLCYPFSPNEWLYLVSLMWWRYLKGCFQVSYCGCWWLLKWLNTGLIPSLILTCWCWEWEHIASIFLQNRIQHLNEVTLLIYCVSRRRKAGDRLHYSRYTQQAPWCRRHYTAASAEVPAGSSGVSGEGCGVCHEETPHERAPHKTCHVSGCPAEGRVWSGRRLVLCRQVSWGIKSSTFIYSAKSQHKLSQYT